MDRPPERRHKQVELREKREELHGKRHHLHERLAQVCEDFVTQSMTKEHRKRALVTELQYLLDFYRDDTNWENID